MKQRKLIYFILGFASFSGVMVIYSVVKGDLATAAFNLVCLAINVWCLRVVHSSGEEHSDGTWAKILNLRLAMAISRMDTEREYSEQLHRITNGMLWDLEKKYNELKERLGPAISKIDIVSDYTGNLADIISRRLTDVDGEKLFDDTTLENKLKESLAENAEIKKTHFDLLKEKNELCKKIVEGLEDNRKD
jgi:hypothetical protein